MSTALPSNVHVLSRFSFFFFSRQAPPSAHLAAKDHTMEEQVVRVSNYQSQLQSIHICQYACSHLCELHACIQGSWIYAFVTQRCNDNRLNLCLQAHQHVCACVVLIWSGGRRNDGDCVLTMPGRILLFVHRLGVYQQLPVVKQ